MAETAKKMNIYEAISRCMEEIGAVGKDAVNKQQGFKYRGKLGDHLGGGTIRLRQSRGKPLKNSFISSQI